MIRRNEQAVKMVYLMFKAGHTLHYKRTYNKIWVMIDNQFKGRTVIAMFSLEKRDADRIAEDI